jgi:hypothetical protein
VDEVVTEVGSGMSGRRPQLARLLSDPEVGTIVVEHRDRLARVGVEHLEAALAAHGRRIVVVESSERTDDLVRDMIEVLTAMCARLYGRRGARNRAMRAVTATNRWHVLPELRGDGKRARWKPAPDPHRVGSGYCHGKTHGVNAAPQGDGCPNRADSHSLTVQVTGVSRCARPAIDGTPHRLGRTTRILHGLADHGVGPVHDGDDRVAMLHGAVTSRWR